MIHALPEENQMLGHRGFRLGMSYPAFTAMQVEATEVRQKLSLKKSDPKSAVGTMIEIPRAAITAELFSFGTNDPS